jgi:hypothetical protein
MTYEGVFTDGQGNSVRHRFSVSANLEVGDAVRSSDIGLSSPVEIWQVSNFESGQPHLYPWPKEEHERARVERKATSD